MGDVYFDGDPEIDSTRRRLERVMKEDEQPRAPRAPRWPWKTALLAGGTAFMWWQLSRRRPRNGDTAGNGGKAGHRS